MEGKGREAGGVRSWKGGELNRRGSGREGN